MKTTERLAGPVRLTLAATGEEEAFVMSADPLGLWLADDTFVPWSAIDRIEVQR